jgi:flagellar hook-associated protein 1 FlgK
MISTFTGVEIGKRSLVTHQAAINVTGHNVANTETDGYSRQMVTLQIFDPLYIPGLTRELTPGQIGQGVEVEKILRARDLLLEDRILGEKNTLAYWKSLSDWIYQVELVHNEPGQQSIMSVLDRFWASWQELANNPEEIGARQAVRESGQALSFRLNHMYQALKSIRDNIEKAVQARVEEINSIARNIAHLNAEILRSESAGDNPNDLWDKRDLLIEKLSGYADIRVGRSDRDEFMVFIGNKHLVQGKHFEELETLTDPDNEGYSTIQWKVDGSHLKLESGELKALLDARDIELKQQIEAIDFFTANIVDLVNSIHRRGFGLNLRTGLNFFKEKPAGVNPLGDYDFNRDGIVDGTAIFRITGSNVLRREEVVGLSGFITLNNGLRVEYTRSDTVNDIITKVNQAGSDVKLFLNSEGRLVVRSDAPSQVISHVEDSGDFLVGYAGILRSSGAEGAFDRGIPWMAQRVSEDFMVTQFQHPSSWVRLDDHILNEVESIAASAGTDTDGDGKPDLSMGAGNGDNALSIAGIRFQRVMIGGSETLNEFYQNLIARTGLSGETARDETASRELLVQNLTQLRQSISGVNIDEELVNLVKFQHGYAAAARFIRAVDEMLNLLITRMV